MNEFGNQFFLARTTSLSRRRATTRFPINAILLLAWFAFNPGGLWRQIKVKAGETGLRLWKMARLAQSLQRRPMPRDHPTRSPGFSEGDSAANRGVAADFILQ